MKVGGQVVALSGGSDHGAGSAFEVVDSASDGSSDDGSFHSAEDRLSGEYSDRDDQDTEGHAPRPPQINETATLDTLSQESSPPAVTSSFAAVEAGQLLTSATTGGSAAGEGWDDLAPFGDVDNQDIANGGESGEGRIGLLPLDGLLFHDSPMYEPSPIALSNRDLFVH